MTTPSFRMLLLASVLGPLGLAGVSDDGRAGWTALDSGTTNALRAVHFTDLDHGTVVGASGTGLKTTDAGVSWQVLNLGVATDLNDVFFQGSTGVIVGNGGIILRTTDAGTNWSPVSSGVSDDLLAVSLSGTGGICSGRSQTILRTTDTGATWQVSQEGFFGGGFAGAAMLSPDIGFVGGENSIFQPLAGKSTNGGQSWEFTAFYLNSNEGRITAIDFTDGNIGYASSAVWDGRGAISKTTDGGQAWTTILFPDVLTGIAFPISDASQFGYAVGQLGRILKTTNAAASWEPQDSGTAVDLEDVYFVDFDNGFAVGAGGTILKTTDGGEGTSALDGAAAQPGTDFRTTFAVPNPFTDQTQIRYEVTRSGPVELSVFDVRGRRVRTLVRGHQDKGTHRMRWDGTDGSGRMLQTGVYHYRISSRDGVKSGRVLVLR